jgi:hypothetical protein
MNFLDDYERFHRQNTKKNWRSLHIPITGKKKKLAELVNFVAPSRGKIE